MPESLQLVLLGLAAIVGGTFVLVRRRRLAKASAKNMTRWPRWSNRFNYSEDYFLMLNTAGGVFIILVGIISLIAAPFKNSDQQMPAPLECLMMAIVGFIFVGGLLLIIYVNFRFRKAK